MQGVTSVFFVSVATCFVSKCAVCYSTGNKAEDLDVEEQKERG